MNIENLDSSSFSKEEKAKLLEKIDTWTGIFEGHMKTSLEIGTHHYDAHDKIKKLKELRGYVERGERTMLPSNRNVEKEMDRVINEN